ncbi:hypothetical protein E2562_004970 [Oryza meyeriana var. granulata]|uniref:Uncharacterized protein n=1 Tax=Oryza meyeriana var. granulata TaxID=110450 RepID=A0A6G1C4M5_9ORYZ|nr:hypothetical protein E2562_004970 [Oryza meyeriana var. granulata]
MLHPSPAAGGQTVTMLSGWPVSSSAKPWKTGALSCIGSQLTGAIFFLAIVLIHLKMVLEKLTAVTGRVAVATAFATLSLVVYVIGPLFMHA